MSFLGDIFEGIGDFFGLELESDLDPYRKGVKTNTKGPSQHLDVVYGVDRVGGVRVGTFVRGDDDQYLYHVYALSHGKIKNVVKLYGAVSGDLTAEDSVTEIRTLSVKWGYLLGSDHQDITEPTGSTLNGEVNGGGDFLQLMAEIGENDTGHRTRIWNMDKGHLKGVAFAVVRFEGSKEFLNKNPTDISFLLQGKEVLDPRTGTTSWSNNPALCYLDYWKNTRYGKGVNYPEGFDLTSFIYSADLFDNQIELNSAVPISYRFNDSLKDEGAIAVNLDTETKAMSIVAGTQMSLTFEGGYELETTVTNIAYITSYSRTQQTYQTRILVYADNFKDNSSIPSGGLRAANVTTKLKKYTCDGSVDTSKNIDKNLQSLATSFNGYATIISGKATLIPDTEVDESDYFPIVFDESNITSGISGKVANYDNRLNAIEGSYSSSADQYDDTTIDVSSDVFLRRDSGRPNSRSVNLPFTKEKAIVHQILTLELNKSRHKGVVQFSVLWDGYDITAGTVIQTKHEKLLWGNESENRLFRVVKVGIPTVENDVSLTAVPYDPADYILGELNLSTPSSYIEEPKVANLTLPENLVVSSSVGDFLSTLKVTWDEADSEQVDSYRIEILGDKQRLVKYDPVTRRLLSEPYLETYFGVVKTYDEVKGDQLYLNYRFIVANDYTIRLRSVGIGGKVSTAYLEQALTFSDLSTPTGINVTYEVPKSVVLDVTYSSADSDQYALNHNWYIAEYDGVTQPTYLDASQIPSSTDGQLKLTELDVNKTYVAWCKPYSTFHSGNVFPNGNGIPFTIKDVLSLTVPQDVTNVLSNGLELTWQHPTITDVSTFSIITSLSSTGDAVNSQEVTPNTNSTTQKIDLSFLPIGEYNIIIRVNGKNGLTSEVAISDIILDGQAVKYVELLDGELGLENLSQDAQDTIGQINLDIQSNVDSLASTNNAVANVSANLQQTEYNLSETFTDALSVANDNVEFREQLLGYSAQVSTLENQVTANATNIEQSATKIELESVEVNLRGEIQSIVTGDIDSILDAAIGDIEGEVTKLNFFVGESNLDGQQTIGSYVNNIVLGQDFVTINEVQQEIDSGGITGIVKQSTFDDEVTTLNSNMEVLRGDLRSEYLTSFTFATDQNTSIQAALTEANLKLYNNSLALLEDNKGFEGSLAAAENTTKLLTDDLSSQALTTEEQFARVNDNISTTNRTLNNVVNEQQATATVIEELKVTDEENLAKAIEYTNVSIGYCVDADGNITNETDAVTCELIEGNQWLKLPLATAIDKVSVTIQDENGDDVTLSAGSFFQVFADNDADLEGKTTELLARAFFGITGEAETGITVTQNQDGSVSSITVKGSTFSWLDDNNNPVLSLDTDTNKLSIDGTLTLTQEQKDELKGADGATIESTTSQLQLNGDYLITINYSDGSMSQYFSPRGPAGSTVTDTQESTLPNGNTQVTITYSNGATNVFTVQKGNKGNDGAGVYSVNDNSLSGFPTDTATVNNLFKVESGRDPVAGDHLNINNTGTVNPFSTTKRYDGSTEPYDDTEWTSPTLQIEGDLLVDGAISGNSGQFGSGGYVLRLNQNDAFPIWYGAAGDTVNKSNAVWFLDSEGNYSKDVTGVSWHSLPDLEDRTVIANKSHLKLNGFIKFELVTNSTIFKDSFFSSSSGELVVRVKFKYKITGSSDDWTYVRTVVKTFYYETEFFEGNHVLNMGFDEVFAAYAKAEGIAEYSALTVGYDMTVSWNVNTGQSPSVSSIWSGNKYFSTLEVRQ